MTVVQQTPSYTSSTLLKLRPNVLFEKWYKDIEEENDDDYEEAGRYRMSCKVFSFGR